MGRLRVADSGNARFPDFSSTSYHPPFDGGAVLNSRGRESLRGDSRKCDWTAVRALSTRALVVSFYTNPRKAFRPRNIRCDSPAVAWNPHAAIEAVRVAHSPVVVITSIRVDVRRGGSITAMTAPP
jgi:hypothetical protein